jgi:hypothetical protein
VITRDSAGNYPASQLTCFYRYPKYLKKVFSSKSVPPRRNQYSSLSSTISCTSHHTVASCFFLLYSLSSEEEPQVLRRRTRNRIIVLPVLLLERLCMTRRIADITQYKYSTGEYLYYRIGIQNQSIQVLTTTYKRQRSKTIHPFNNYYDYESRKHEYI